MSPYFSVHKALVFLHHRNYQIMAEFIRTIPRQPVAVYYHARIRMAFSGISARSRIIASAFLYRKVDENEETIQQPSTYIHIYSVADNIADNRTCTLSLSSIAKRQPPNGVNCG